MVNMEPSEDPKLYKIVLEIIQRREFYREKDFWIWADRMTELDDSDQLGHNFFKRLWDKGTAVIENDYGHSKVKTTYNVSIQEDKDEMPELRQPNDAGEAGVSGD